MNYCFHGCPAQLCRKCAVDERDVALKQRDEAREVAKRLLKTFAAHYSAIGGDTSWGEWILAYYYPWLADDQPASGAGGGGVRGEGATALSACLRGGVLDL